jgi:hypothetical protein
MSTTIKRACFRKRLPGKPAMRLCLGCETPHMFHSRDEGNRRCASALRMDAGGGRTARMAPRRKGLAI